MGAGSQFFIVHAPKPHLDGEYTAFGEVVEGMDTVDKIAAVKTAQANHPVKPVRIRAVRVLR